MKRAARFLPSVDSVVWKRQLELVLWACLLSLAFYPGKLGFLAWFALVRPFMIIAQLRGRAAFTASYWFGFWFNVFALYWVALVTPPGTFAAVVIVAGYYAVMLYAFNRCYRIKPLFGLLALPFLWVGTEYFRTLSQFAFPWSDLGYTQADYLYIIQIVSVISVHGLSFIIVGANALLWQVFRTGLSTERRLTAGFLSIAVVVILLAYGWIEVPRFPLPGKYDITILQGSVPLEIKWQTANEQYSLQLYDSLAQTVSDTTVKLLVWPETAAPSYLSHSRRDRLRVGEIARKTRAYHLVGALGARTDRDHQWFYNSCYQVTPSGQIERRYDKVKLVPFSEQVPYQDYLPFLRKEFLTKYLTFIKTYDIQWWSDFRPGDSLVIFDLPDAAYAVLICFESTFPELSREAVKRGANFLVGITNDTWFDGSVGPWIHSRIFLTRAVENRTWVVRAANSGISYIADGYGRIRSELPEDTVATLTGGVRLLEHYSVFTRVGDIAGKTSFLITIGLLGILIGRWLREKLFSFRPS